MTPMSMAGERRRVSWRAGVGYVLFVVAATMTFVVVFFPYGRLQTVVLAELSRQMRARVTVESSEWTFPVGAGWRGVRIQPLDGASPDTLIDILRVRVAVVPLLRRVIDAELAWEAYGGRGRGTWTVRRDGDHIRSALDQIAQGIDLARLPRTPAGEWRGTMRIDLSLQWADHVWWGGDGSGSLEMRDVRADHLVIGGFPVDGFAFDSVSGQVGLKGGTITVQRLSARGALGTVSGSGTVLARVPWTESVVNMTLSLTPAPGAAAKAPWLALAGTGGPIAVQIKGRAAAPDITLNGARLS